MVGKLNGIWAVRIGLVAVGLSLASAAQHVFAAQLVSSQDCNFVMHVPGLLGGKNLQLRMQKGAVFTENQNHKFCGPVTQATPFGDSTGNQCFVITDGKLISGPWSDKITSSDCALSDAAAMQAPFVATDLVPWAGDGPAGLHGQAFLKTVGGDVKTCAGARVLLLPVTPYVDELLAKRKAGISLEADPRLEPYTRATICDAQGNFSFAGLPAQRWHIVTSVTWGVPNVAEPGDEPETDQQGGQLLQTVKLAPGDNQVLLTYRDQR